METNLGTGKLKMTIRSNMQFFKTWHSQKRLLDTIRMLKYKDAGGSNSSNAVTRISL